MIKTDDVKEKIFEFAYGAGLRDATVQRSYKCKDGEKKLLRKNDEAKNTVKEYVDAILNGTPCDFYETAQRVKESFNQYEKSTSSSGKFSFGNAQKLINMTVKFMYISIYTKPDLRCRFKGCHCPLDNIMGKKIKDKISALVKEKSYPCELEKIIKRGKWKGWDANWSKIDVESYKDYQSAISYFSDCDGMLPIEYDYFNWQ